MQDLDIIRAKYRNRRLALGMPEGLTQLEEISWMMQRNLAELERQGKVLEALRRGWPAPDRRKRETRN